MLILGIESSALVASAAIMAEDRLVAEYTMNNRKTHSQTLLPMIDEIVKAAEINLNDIDAIAVSRGPGSFTGLRIGSATAKGLAQAIDKPIVEVPTLDALAYNLFGTTDSLICPIMDARRQEVYSGIYCYEEGSVIPKALEEESAGPLSNVIDRLNAYGRPVIFLGDGVPVNMELIAERTTVKYTFAPNHLSRQRAASVAALGLEMFKAGKFVNASAHVPVYLRVSQAEREKNAQ